MHLKQKEAHLENSTVNPKIYFLMPGKVKILHKLSAAHNFEDAVVSKNLLYNYALSAC